MVDSSDLYLETISEDGKYYWYDGRWVALKQRRELITVRGRSEPVELIVSTTHHGPILSNLFDLADHKSPHQFKSLSLSWNGHLRHDGTLIATMNMGLANNIDQVRAMIPVFTTPILNIVYATVDSHIGYFTLGKLSVKRDPENIFVRDGTIRKNDLVRLFDDDETP